MWVTCDVDVTAIEDAAEGNDSSTYGTVIVGRPRRIPDQTPPAAGAHLPDTRPRHPLAAVDTRGFRCSGGPGRTLPAAGFAKHHRCTGDRDPGRRRSARLRARIRRTCGRT